MTSKEKPGSKNFRRTASYNLLIFFVVVNLIYWTIPVVGSLSELIKTSPLSSRTRPVPPNYSEADAGWLRTYWAEHSRSLSVYKSYIGWRRAPVTGETINVEGPYLQRRTENRGTSSERKAYFFGGSAMWGDGSDDARTIPSQFAAITGVHSENFGEGAWVAHQSLTLLIQLIQAGHRPDLVVFYDGVNEVLQKCRRGLAPEAHGREQQFTAILGRGARPYNFAHYLAPFVVLAQNIAAAFVAIDGYDCPQDSAKANAIAEALLRDWQFAKDVVERHGGQFVGLLQPVSYFSRTRLDHLSLPRDYEQQYRTVYPIMRKKTSEQPGFYDLSSALDVDEYVYLDWAHLSPNGNRYVAERIADIVASLGVNR